MAPKQTEAQHQAFQLLQSQKSLHLATCSPKSQACISYAPYISQNDKLYILISDLAEHTLNLKSNSECSAMIIADEQASIELFARQRLQYQMSASQVERKSLLWDQVIKAMHQKLGKTVAKLIQLTDFHLFELTPIKGKFIGGFGKAFTLEASTLIGKKIRHIGAQRK